MPRTRNWSTPREGDAVMGTTTSSKRSAQQEEEQRTSHRFSKKNNDVPATGSVKGTTKYERKMKTRKTN